MQKLPVALRYPFGEASQAIWSTLNDVQDMCRLGNLYQALGVSHKALKHAAQTAEIIRGFRSAERAPLLLTKHANDFDGLIVTLRTLENKLPQQYVHDRHVRLGVDSNLHNCSTWFADEQVPTLENYFARFGTYAKEVELIRNAMTITKPETRAPSL